MALKLAKKNRAGETATPHFRIYGDYPDDEPAFFDAGDFPWTDTLRRNWKVIRDEFEQHFLRERQKLSVNFVPDAVDVTGWRGICLFTCMLPYRRNCARLPRTAEILQSIPNIASAFVNLLEPHTDLPAHYGDSNVFHRAHLGLIVPAGVESCAMQVGDERIGWREGEVFVFNDARYHTVWNHSDRPRVVLVCDVVKPRFRNRALWHCSQVLGAIGVTFLQARLPVLRRAPRFVTSGLHVAASLPFRVYLGLFGLQGALVRKTHRSRSVGEIAN